MAMVFPWYFFEIGNTYFFCKTSALTSANYAADINYYGVILFLFIFLLYDIHCIKQNKMVVVGNFSQLGVNVGTKANTKSLRNKF